MFSFVVLEIIELSGLEGTFICNMIKISIEGTFLDHDMQSLTTTESFIFPPHLRTDFPSVWLFLQEKACIQGDLILKQLLHIASWPLSYSTVKRVPSSSSMDFRYLNTVISSHYSLELNKYHFPHQPKTVLNTQDKQEVVCSRKTTESPR